MAKREAGSAWRSRSGKAKGPVASGGQEGGSVETGATRTVRFLFLLVKGGDSLLCLWKPRLPNNPLPHFFLNPGPLLFLHLLESPLSPFHLCLVSP